MAKTPSPDITLTIDHWPPSIEDIHDAFEDAEQWADVTQVTMNGKDFQVIDFQGNLSSLRGGVMALWGAEVVRVEKSHGMIQFMTGKVTVRGPKFGDRVKVLLAAPRA